MQKEITAKSAHFSASHKSLRLHKHSTVGEMSLKIYRVKHQVQHSKFLATKINVFLVPGEFEIDYVGCLAFGLDAARYIGVTEGSSTVTLAGCARSAAGRAGATYGAGS